MNDIMLINDAIKKHRELSEYYDAMGCKDDVMVQERYIVYLSELRRYKEQEKMCEDQATLHPVDEFKCSACGIHLAEWVRKETDEETGDVTNYEYEPKFCPNCGKKIRR